LLPPDPDQNGAIIAPLIGGKASIMNDDIR
jgi:hypothetical protein